MTRTHSILKNAREKNPEKKHCVVHTQKLCYIKRCLSMKTVWLSLCSNISVTQSTATTIRNINNIMQFLFCQTIIVVHGYIMKYWSLQIIAISFKVLKFISFFVVSKRYMLLIQFQQILCSRKFNNILFCCCFGLVFLIIF